MQFLGLTCSCATLPATLVIRTYKCRRRQFLEFRRHFVSLHSDHEVVMKRARVVLLQRRAGAARDQIKRRLRGIGTCGWWRYGVRLPALRVVVDMLVTGD